MRCVYNLIILYDYIVAMNIYGMNGVDDMHGRRRQSSALGAYERKTRKNCVECRTESLCTNAMPDLEH